MKSVRGHNCYLLCKLVSGEELPHKQWYPIFLFLYPMQRSCAGYNVFDLSVHQPVYLSCFLSSQLLSNRPTKFHETFLDNKDILCRCAYRQEITIQTFSMQNRFYSLLKSIWWPTCIVISVLFGLLACVSFTTISHPHIWYFNLL